MSSNPHIASAEARLNAWKIERPEVGSLLTNPRLAEHAAQVWACSEFVAQSCLRQPSLLSALCEGDGRYRALGFEELSAGLQRECGELGDDALQEGLRRFRRRHMVRIAWRDIAGKNVANPSALVLAACMMLDHLGDGERAQRIRRALEGTIRDGKTVTRDLGGTATTTQFTEAVIARL